MSTITFRVNSIQLKPSTINELNRKNAFRLNLTQRPRHISEEYLVKDNFDLEHLNHEWIIEDAKNSVEKVTLTLRTVEKRFNLSKFLRRRKNHHENCNSKINTQYEYVEPEKSLIGYCTINLKEQPIGSNSTIRTELMTRGDVKIVGFADLDVLIIKNQPEVTFAYESTNSENETIDLNPNVCESPLTYSKCQLYMPEPTYASHFIDPGLPSTDAQIEVF